MMPRSLPVTRPRSTSSAPPSAHPVNGYVTNLILRIGDYATPGVSKMTLVDSDSFWIAGYFEETKLPRIQPGDYAHVRLIGWGPEIAGHVNSISRAIADTNSDPNAQGLANVNPIFTWSVLPTHSRSHRHRSCARQCHHRRRADLHHRHRFRPEIYARKVSGVGLFCPQNWRAHADNSG